MHLFIRVFSLVCTLLLTSCINSLNNSSKNSLAMNCPGFSENMWKITTVPQELQTKLINKQKFAVPDSFQTLWFQSKSNAIGLCIVPDRQNRGSIYGCGSAYAVFDKKQDLWQLADQVATICR